MAERWREFLARPAGRWLTTLFIAGALLALGYQEGHRAWRDEVAHWQRQAAEQEGRANRLAAEMESLEERFALLERRLAGLPLAEESRPGGLASRTVAKGRAVVLLEGKATVGLLEVEPNPRRARVSLKTAEGGERETLLALGSSLAFKVEGKTYHLVATAISAVSLSFALVAP